MKELFRRFKIHLFFSAVTVFTVLSHVRDKMNISLRAGTDR